MKLLSEFFNHRIQSPGQDNQALASIDIERAYRAKEILTAQLAEPPTLAELSKQLNTNEYKLKTSFKEVFNTTPYAYHLEYKLEIARSYILDTQLTIAEIAFKMGYSDPAHFTHAFRKQYGFPPSKLR